MRRLFEVSDDPTGNLPPMSAVFPDMLAPVVRVADGVSPCAGACRVRPSSAELR